MNKQGQVMLIDDDEINNFVFSKLFRNCNANAILKIFTSGHQAFLELKKLRANSESLPDVIIVDLKMPVMGGLEFIRKFKEHFKRDFPFIKLMVLTAGVSREEESGLQNYIAPEHILLKPIRLNSLKNLLVQHKALQ